MNTFHNFHLETRFGTLLCGLLSDNSGFNFTGKLTLHGATYSVCGTSGWGSAHCWDKLTKAASGKRPSYTRIHEIEAEINRVALAIHAA